jgi:hypothetical protein
VLAVALVAEDRRAFLDHDPAVAGLLDGLEEGAQSGARLRPRVPVGSEGRRDRARGVGLHPLEDRLEQRLLAAEVVVERSLRDPGARHDRIQAGAGVPVLGEELGGDVDQRPLRRGGVLRTARRAGSLPQDFRGHPPSIGPAVCIPVQQITVCMLAYRG